MYATLHGAYKIFRNFRGFKYIWHYRHSWPPMTVICCTSTNRHPNYIIQFIIEPLATTSWVIVCNRKSVVNHKIIHLWEWWMLVILSKSLFYPEEGLRLDASTSVNQTNCFTSCRYVPENQRLLPSDVPLAEDIHNKGVANSHVAECSTNPWINQNKRFSWVANDNWNLPGDQISSRIMGNETRCEPMKVSRGRSTSSVVQGRAEKRYKTY